jgi:hypothetical protein
MVAVWILIAEIACVFLWHCSYRGIPKVIPQKRGGAVVAPRAETRVVKKLGRWTNL